MTKIGAKVETLQQLFKAVENRRAVFQPSLQGALSKPQPAAWVINMSGAVLYQILKQGLFIYERAEDAKVTTEGNTGEQEDGAKKAKGRIGGLPR